jgi:mono/diheme cytochrome c family protein
MSCCDVTARRSLQTMLFRIVVTGLMPMTIQLSRPAVAVADDFFERHVRPVLLDRCVECHGPKKQEGGLRLDQRKVMMTGSASDVPLIKAGAPEQSRVAQVIAWSDDDVQMPPDGKLNDVEVHAINAWISSGGVWPESSDLEQAALRRAEAWRQHWAFQPVKAPEFTADVEMRNPIDLLVQRRLQDEHLLASSPADARVLVRRMSVALSGLPPDPAEYADASNAEAEDSLDLWLADYADRLLASPQFGERWARYWMDVARYADTKGYVFTADREYRDAWRFREWVINALNADMPYDEFLKRQLAADQLPGSDDPAQLAAMGFLTLGRRFLNNRHDIIDDRIDVVSRGMLGLTATCARCHDHKFDPIPAADYYALYGVFASSDEPGDEPSSLRLVDRKKPVTPHIFLRGSPRNRGEKVTRHFFTALAGPDGAEFHHGSGRLELAEAIASEQNPLTARVAVNRIWMHLFGRGLVDSPSDFGVRTPPPTHPELLDYLASSLMQRSWSTKHIIRSIVTSKMWQQSSQRREDAEAIDPENRLLARMNRRRLDFEAQRDAILSCAGTLDTQIGGESIDIAGDEVIPRRTVYARIDRQNLPGIFRTFDLASPDQHAPRRYETTVPQQALFQMNHPFMMSQATELVRLVTGGQLTAHDDSTIVALFQRVYQREPSEVELEASIAFVQSSTEQARNSGESSPDLLPPLVQLAQTLMMTNEFVFVD